MGRDESPSLRRLVHVATGDREAEAEALRDEADDEVSEHDAKVAVQRAHGDAGAKQPKLDHEIATPEDAENVHDERT
jgi:hypothetical protein